MQPETNTPLSKNTEQQSTPSSHMKTRLSKRAIIIGGVLLVLILGLSLGMLFGEDPQQVPEKKSGQAAQPTAGFEEIKRTAENSPNAKASSHVLVYGTWTGQSSLIKALELSTNTTSVLATLPMEIKKVSVIDNNTLLYIDQVDKRDHGKKVTVYDLKQKKVLASIPASAGFGIDEYALSPDKKSLALWEVQFAPGSEVLQGGKSRVYSVKLDQPTSKNLLYDESAASQVHYPRAILNDGTVFADTFMPNDPNGGAGWAYGMSIVSFDGSVKKDIPAMKRGTYGTQPTLSADGKFLLFAGYDGKYGDGNAIKSGIRQAILTPNTVDLLNTQTLQRYKLANLPNTDSYPSARWDYTTGKVILSIVGAQAERTGLYSYDITQRSSELVEIPKINNIEFIPVSSLTTSTTLIGSFDENASNLGNLGENYEYAYNKVAVYDKESRKTTDVRLEDSYVQYITVEPKDYFAGVLGTKTIAQANPTIIDQYSDKNATKERLQLYTFFLKAELQPTRLKQQSTPVVYPTTSFTQITGTPRSTGSRRDDDNMPKCNDVTAKVCAEKGQGPETKEYVKCKAAYKVQNMERTCDDSPLYLYGTPGQKVDVKIHTPVYNAIPAYNNGYTITLLADDKMQINNDVYDSISYDYSSNLKIRRAPSYGTVLSKNEVVPVLREYARKLALNKKETADLINAGKKKITSPYAFISFYDHETSHMILPITFNPQPDSYRNIVFYFKLLNEKPTYTPVPPQFEPVVRTGLTAVEISEVVER